MGLCHELNALIAELPPGAVIDKPPKRKADRKPAPQTLSAIVKQICGELPKGKFSVEDALVLKEQYDTHATARKYLRALFGDDYER